LKEYTLKFGLHYKINIWHVIYQDRYKFKADCNPELYMGSIDIHTHKRYIYPITEQDYITSMGYEVNPNLSYSRLCPKCKKKFQLTEEDINHYIVLAKFGIKI